MIPMTTKIGNAKVNRPFSTRPIKKSGSNTTENTILEMPHVALIANPRIYPNTASIKIKNRKVNMYDLPPPC